MTSPACQLETHFQRVLQQTAPPLCPDNLRAYVKRQFKRREKCLELWKTNGGTPLYVLDQDTLRERAGQFQTAFRSHLSDTAFFFAMKSNNHPDVSAVLLESGFGLDVSSGIELERALKLGARNIIFSGPGKTAAEHNLALDHADRVVVLMDSFGELERLAALAESRQITIRTGIRLTPPGPHGWRKFGIPITRLREFWQTAASKPSISLEGIQFHTSWNLNATAQVETIQALGQELATWPTALSSLINFIDIGGGFWPTNGEWLQAAAHPPGSIAVALGAEKPPWHIRYHMPAISINEFATALAEALHTHILSVVNCRICFEPGRWLANEAMHLLISVVDRKEDDLVITDAGTNTIGWERFEQDYAPILNLSRPALTEHECLILGSLCTPHDLWSNSYWGTDIQPGDVLLIPDQGAYTYSLRQEFIKPLPSVKTI